jgi:hypothetical protein
MRDTKEDLTKQKSCVHVSKVSVFLKPIIWKLIKKNTIIHNKMKPDIFVDW